MSSRHAPPLVQSALLLTLCLLCAGCSETRRASSPGPSPSSAAAPVAAASPNEGDPAADEGPPAVEPTTAPPLTGPSPWDNSVTDDDINEEACGTTAMPIGPACSANSDCGICHDGSSCGRAANREEIERAGAACRIEDAAECEYALVRCCAGHCRVTGN